MQWKRRSDPGQRHRRLAGGGLIAVSAVGAVVLAGLVGLALTVLRSPAAGPVSPAAGPASWGAGPASPPARICGNKAILEGGPSVPPKGAVIIPAGDDSGTVLGRN